MLCMSFMKPFLHNKPRPEELDGRVQMLVVS